MNKKKQVSESGKIDWILLSLYLALVSVGWVMIYAVSYDNNPSQNFFSIDYNAGRQMIFIGISFFALFFVLAFDSNIWRTFSYGFYFIGLALLILVLFAGKEINGQKAWFSILFYFSTC